MPLKKPNQDLKKKKKQMKHIIDVVNIPSRQIWDKWEYIHH